MHLNFLVYFLKKIFKLIAVFTFLFNNFILSAVEKDLRPQSLYSSYFMIKELCKSFLYSYFIEKQQIKQIKIACCKCHTAVTKTDLWGYCAVLNNEPMLKKLMVLLYQGSTEELSEFLLIAYQQLNIKCYACQEYNGWYIVKQQPSTNI